MTSLTASRTSNISVRDIMEQEHGTSIINLKEICTPASALKGLVVVGIVAFFVWVINAQEKNLILVAVFVRELGIAGRVIFFIYFLFVGLPFGYNWSTGVVLCGYAYGWMGLLDASLGTLGGALLGYYFSRYCMKEWVIRKVEMLGAQKKLYLTATFHLMEGGGFLSLVMMVVVRMTPLTAGLANAAIGVAANVSVVLYLLSVIIGSGPNLVILVSAGTLVGTLGSLSAALASESGRSSVGIQIGTFVFISGFVLFYYRYFKVKVLPGLIPEDAMVEIVDNAEAPAGASAESPADASHEVVLPVRGALAKEVTGEDTAAPLSDATPQAVTVSDATPCHASDTIEGFVASGGTIEADTPVVSL